MYNHFTITVTTVQNSGMIGLGWLTGTAFDWLRSATKTRPKGLWLPLQAQLLPMWVEAVLIHVAYIRQWNWADQSVKSLISKSVTLPDVPPSPIFHSVLLYNWPRYWLFSIFPLATMLNFKFKIPISNFCEEGTFGKTSVDKNNNCRRSSILEFSLP